MEEAGLMGFSGGSEQGKLVTALLQLMACISVKTKQVNAKPDGVNHITGGTSTASNAK